MNTNILLNLKKTELNICEKKREKQFHIYIQIAEISIDHAFVKTAKSLIQYLLNFIKQFLSNNPETVLLLHKI